MSLFNAIFATFLPPAECLAFIMRTYSNVARKRYIGNIWTCNTPTHTHIYIKLTISSRVWYFESRH